MDELGFFVPSNSDKAKEVIPGQAAPKARMLTQPEPIEDDRLTIKRIFQFLYKYFVKDVFTPAAKQFGLDALDNATNSARKIILNGEPDPMRRGRTDYNGISRTSLNGGTLVVSGGNRPAAGSGKGFVSPAFATAEAAMSVVREMNEKIKRYGNCSIKDVYTLSECNCDYPNNSWGWTTMVDPRSAVSGAYRDQKGERYYLLELPPIERIS